MATPTLPFLQPIEEVRERLLKLQSEPSSLERDDALAVTKRELEETIESVFSDLTPWQRCQVARHPERPYTLDYINGTMTGFVELHGDRSFADDPAIVAGFAQLEGDPVAVIGHQKGRSTSEKVRRNFGMPRPEGYRKALRVMRLAARFGRPVVTFIDTPGAYPGIDAEERGQAEAIAANLLEMARLPVPIVVVVTGEGGSGGALALGIGDRIMMLEHSIYSVISPEGCAAILWKDQARAQDAASALKITAPDLKQLGVIDEVIPEPLGGAHMDPPTMCRSISAAVRRALKELRRSKTDALLQRRYRKFRTMGRFLER